MPDSTTIILNSGGGFGPPAFMIGRAIRSRGLATKIPAGARCDSACSLIWLAGVRREIDCQARIGLHAPRKSRTFEPSEPGDKYMADYMAEMGAPKEMIDLALQTDLASATYVDHAQLRQWGLVNSPACPPKPSIKFRPTVRLGDETLTAAAAATVGAAVRRSPAR